MMPGARIIGMGMTLVVAALHAWSARHAANADGISYLDLGDAFARGDLANAVNAHWSPAYALLLGLVLRTAAPGPYWEFTVVHGVNLVILGCGVVAFDRLLRQLQRDAEATAGPLRPLPAWVWYACGYLLFAWSTLQFVTMAVVSPDLAVLVVVVAAAALVVRLRRGGAGRGTFALFGGLLGLGYLVKAPLFPLAFVFLAGAGLAVRQWRVAASGVAVAALVFGAIAAPQVAALSVQKGRPTFGESGRLAYAWFVDGVPLRHWHGGPPAGGVATHPTRRVGRDPAIHEFATPIAGSYPVWYDPSYWYDGIAPSGEPGRIGRTLARNAADWLDLIVSRMQLVLAALCVTAVVLAGTMRASFAALVRQRDLLLPVAAGLAAYSATGVLTRYVAPFLLLFWVIVLSSIRRPDTARQTALWAGGVAALAVILALELGPTALDGVRDLARGEASGDHVLYDVAAGLRRAGVGSGSAVAAIHPPPPPERWAGMTGWARLAGVRIVAEIAPADAPAYWLGSAETRDRALQTLAATGAQAVVTMAVPPGPALDGWEPLGSTGYYVRRLDTAAIATRNAP